MRNFYRQALVAFGLLLIADALIAWLCLYQGYPSAGLLPRKGGAPNRHFAAFTDVSYGGASTVRIHDATQQALGFDFRLSEAIPHPSAWAALVFDGAAAARGAKPDGKLAIRPALPSGGDPTR